MADNNLLKIQDGKTNMASSKLVCIVILYSQYLQTIQLKQGKNL